jgi:hypothetical protein
MNRVNSWRVICGLVLKICLFLLPPSPLLAQSSKINDRWIGAWQLEKSNFPIDRRSDSSITITSSRFDKCIWGKPASKQCGAGYTGVTTKAELLSTLIPFEKANANDPKGRDGHLQARRMLQELSNDSFRIISTVPSIQNQELGSGDCAEINYIFDRECIYRIHFCESGSFASVEKFVRSN